MMNGTTKSNDVTLAVRIVTRSGIMIVESVEGHTLELSCFAERACFVAVASEFLLLNSIANSICPHARAVRINVFRDRRPGT